MKDPRKTPFTPYLRCLADLVGLRDWSVRIADNPPDDPGHHAVAGTIAGRKCFEVEIGELFLDSSPYDQRATLCHELIHAHLAPMDHMLCKVLGDEARGSYKLLMEYAVDGMAEEWAKHLPLPDQVRPKAIPTTKAKPKPKPKPKPKGKRR